MFDSKYRKIQQKYVSLPSEILAFRLMNRANITKTERLLIMAGVNYEDRSTLYDQAIKLLKKFKGDRETSTENCIKLEPAYLASGGYVKPTQCKQFVREQDVIQARGGYQDKQTGMK